MASDIFEQIRARAFEKADKLKADFDAKIDALIAENNQLQRISTAVSLSCVVVSIAVALFCLWILWHSTAPQ